MCAVFVGGVHNVLNFNNLFFKNIWIENNVNESSTKQHLHHKRRISELRRMLLNITQLNTAIHDVWFLRFSDTIARPCMYAHSLNNNIDIFKYEHQESWRFKKKSCSRVGCIGIWYYVPWSCWILISYIIPSPSSLPLKVENFVRWNFYAKEEKRKTWRFSLLARIWCEEFRITRNAFLHVSNIIWVFCTYE